MGGAGGAATPGIGLVDRTRCQRDQALHARSRHAALACPNLPMTQRSHDLGYGKPPAATRFQKGQSGNPSGRPRGSKAPPYESVLGQIVTIREDGIERRVTAAEAFLLHMTKRGLEGDGPAARAAMAAIEEARAVRGPGVGEIGRAHVRTP